jgi:hypothetical protein
MSQHTTSLVQADGIAAKQTARWHRSIVAALVAVGILGLVPMRQAVGAPGDHVHTEPTGTLSALGADSSYHWAAVNTAMHVNLHLASPDDVDYISGALVNGQYVESYWAGGAKGTCSPLVHATDSQWSATGTGYTTISVTLFDQTDNTETNDVNPTKQLIDVVGGFTFDSATAYQLYGGNNTYSEITVVSGGEKTLFICPSNQYRLTAASTPATGPFRVWIRYNHVPNGTPVTGDFSGSNPVFGPVGSGETQSNYLGIDVDRDSVLDQSEESTIIAVTRIDFEDAVAYDQRTMPTALAEALFPLVGDEHMEVGGTFYFELQGPNLDDGALLAYELRHAQTGTVVKSGTGRHFSHTWAASPTGGFYLNLFLDCNGNGVGDLTETPFFADPFWVQAVKVYTFNTVYSNAIAALGAPTPGQVEAKYAASAKLGLIRHSADDFRTCVEFALGTLTKDTSGGPDPVTVDVDDDDWFDLSHHVTLVNSFSDNTLGLAIKPSDPPKIILDWNSTTDAAFIHEVAHTVGRDHYEGSDTTRIMLGEDSSGKNKLSDWEAFDLD